MLDPVDFHLNIQSTGFYSKHCASSAPTSSSSAVKSSRRFLFEYKTMRKTYVYLNIFYDVSNFVYHYYLFTHSDTSRHCQDGQKSLIFSVSLFESMQNYLNCRVILHSWHELIKQTELQHQSLLELPLKLPPELLLETYTLCAKTYLVLQVAERLLM